MGKHRVLLAFLAGVLISFAVTIIFSLLLTSGSFANQVETFILFIGIGCLVFILILGTLYLLKDRILTWLGLYANNQLNEVQEPLVKAAQHFTKGDFDEGYESVGQFAKYILSWKVSIGIRNLLFYGVIGILGAVLTLLGTSILLQQNKLINNQNALMEAESQPSFKISLNRDTINDCVTATFKNTGHRVIHFNLETRSYYNIYLQHDYEPLSLYQLNLVDFIHSFVSLEDGTIKLDIGCMKYEYLSYKPSDAIDSVRIISHMEVEPLFNNYLKKHINWGKSNRSNNTSQNTNTLKNTVNKIKLEITTQVVISYLDIYQKPKYIRYEIEYPYISSPEFSIPEYTSTKPIEKEDGFTIYSFTYQFATNEWIAHILGTILNLHNQYQDDEFHYLNEKVK